jgi:hypothetical protein
VYQLTAVDTRFDGRSCCWCSALRPVRGPLASRAMSHVGSRRLGVAVRRCSLTTDRGGSRGAASPSSPPAASTTIASRHAVRTATPPASGSTAPRSRSAGAPRSADGGSRASASSRTRWTRGSSATTAGAATMVTSCGPHPFRGPRLRRAQPSIMSANQRVQLSPRTPARKPEPCAEDGSSGGCVLAVGDRCGDCWRARLPPVIVGDEDLLLDSHEG